MNTAPKIADLTFVPAPELGEHRYKASPALQAVGEALTEDGDTYDVEGGRITLHVQPDPDYSINDFDSHGRMEWTRNNGHGPVRPDDFDGTARIIERERHDTLWWQPPGEEIMGKGYVWTDADLSELESRVRDLHTFGFHIVSVSYTTVIGAEESTSLGGVDSICSGLVCEMVAELAAEIPALVRRARDWSDSMSLKRTA